MKLQSRSSNRSGERALDGIRNSACFCRTSSQHKHPPAGQYGADAHGDRETRHLLPSTKEFAIVLHRRFAEHLQACFRRKTGRRFVEADVPIAPDSQDLQVDAARTLNFSFIPSAIFFVVATDGAIWDMNISRIKIYMRKKMFRHEMMKTLRVLGRNPQIFV